MVGVLRMIELRIYAISEKAHKELEKTLKITIKRDMEFNNLTQARNFATLCRLLSPGALIGISEK